MPNNYKFDITPHIVKQLGEQLVPDEITALLELIKNAYDADATYVSIEINTTGKYTKEKLAYPEHKGFIVVEDDGFGMNEETILKSWLVISYSEKRQLKKDRKTTPKGRTPLGDKGLGRLSTQRLANKCEIFTKKENEAGGHLAFDWKDFEKKDKLSDVEVKSNPYTTKKKKGTILILSDINYPQVWKGKGLEKFKGQVSQLISPYKENRPFEVFISVNGINIDLEKSNEQLRDLAISRFSFEFNKLKSKDTYELNISGKTKLIKFRGNKKEEFNLFLQPDNGKKFGKFLIEKYPHIKLSNDNNYFLEFTQTFSFEKDIPSLDSIEVVNNKKRKKIKANPGNFSGLIDEFTFGSGVLDDEIIKDTFGKFENYKNFAQNQSGIKIYRNGFAVLPYGLDDNKDWLKLSESQTKSTFYDIRPTNTIGYFSIDEKDNSFLKDKTDRQGFVSNPHSNNFMKLAYFIRDAINSYQRSIRRTYDDFLEENKKENSGIQTVTQSFKELKKIDNSSKKVTGEIAQAETDLSDTISEQEDIVSEVEKNSLFTSEENHKEYKKAKKLLERLKKVQASFKELQSIIEKTKKLDEVVNILEPKIQILEERLSDFSELAALGLAAEAVSHEFATIADRLAEKSNFYSNKLQSGNLSDADIYVLMEYIDSTVNGLKIQLKHLDPALKYNREKRSTFKLSDFFKEEKKYYEHRFKNARIDFIINKTDDFKVRVNRGKLIQIIDNLIINSEYWLKEKRRNNKKFTPKITINIEKPWLYIFDNGYGIPPAIENHIFEPFVTTKPKGEGRGLGLFIIQQLLDGMNCFVSLEPERNKEDRRYIFAINLANIITE